MNSEILANVSRMFARIEPCYVSGSAAELGPCAGAITWRNALKIAANHENWLESDLDSACEDMRMWAIHSGAWHDDETSSWSVAECLALFVQNVASELRMLGSDDDDLEACVAKYASTDGDKQSEYPVGYYEAKPDGVHVVWYAGR